MLHTPAHVRSRPHVLGPNVALGQVLAIGSLGGFKYYHLASDFIAESNIKIMRMKEMITN